MILNSSLGFMLRNKVRDGDARITIRGFSQRNVGVMIDGVPLMTWKMAGCIGQTGLD